MAPLTIGVRHRSDRSDGIVIRERIPICANEKGGVVRRPFSKLQAWLIAVSPQPGVALAIGTDRAA